MLTPECASVQEHAPELALGILDGAERAEVLHHLSTCARCQTLVDEHTEVVDLLAQLAPEAEPPPGFERRVLRAVRGDRRHSVRRWAAVVAATAAAAAILSVAVVRIVDAGRDQSTPTAAPALRSVAMVGADGHTVGRVTLSHGSPSGVLVNVDYSVPDGAYTLELRRGAAASESLGTITIAGGHGEWSGSAALPAKGVAAIALVDAKGVDVCTAVLRTASA